MICKYPLSMLHGYPYPIYIYILYRHLYPYVYAVIHTFDSARYTWTQTATATDVGVNEKKSSLRLYILHGLLVSRRIPLSISLIISLQYILSLLLVSSRLHYIVVYYRQYQIRPPCCGDSQKSVFRRLTYTKSCL